MIKNSSIQDLKYFIYARKSSESEDRQMASIDDQIAELKKIAEEYSLDVVDILSESKSAKSPGRTVFNEMLQRIHEGEAHGIICWKLNRLARNPIDGGQISWMIQQNTIKHIQTYGRSYYPTDNVIMMAVELGMANQFIRDLSVDTKRGLRAKAERGWYPSGTTLGYTHNPLKKKGEKEIITDADRFELVRKMWDLMLSGVYSPRKIWSLARDEWNLTTKKGKKIALSTVYRILNDPFYYGEFEYPRGSGHWIKGNHTPMITRQEFDRVQALLGKKGLPRPKTHDFAFRGPLICGECGCMVTAESKVKKQKNGNVHNYTFYHCTKKRRDSHCSQRSIEEKELQKQISDILGEIELPDDFCKWALEVLKENNVVEVQGRTQIINNQRVAYDKILKRLDNLIEMRADGELTDEEFSNSKSVILEEKRRLELLMDDTSQRSSEWLEQTEKYLNFARDAKEKFDTTDSLEVKRSILSSLGSNLTLKDKKLNVYLEKPLIHLKGASAEVRAIKDRLEPLKDGSTTEDLRDLYSRNPMVLRG